MTNTEANAMTDSLAVIAALRECDPFQDAVPCFDWTPEAWRAVEYADTKLINTPWGFKAL